MRGTITTIGGAVLAAALLAGCSGGSDGSDGSGGDAASPGAASSSAGQDETADEPVTEAGQAYCDGLERLGEAGDDVTDPEATRDTLDQLAEDAPEGSAERWREVSSAYDRYADQVQSLLSDLPDVPGVDEQQLLERNRDRVEGLADRYLGDTAQLRQQLETRGREDCGLEP